MKTPEEILMSHSPTPAAGYHSSWIIPAMKEYAAQERNKAIDECIALLLHYRGAFTTDGNYQFLRAEIESLRVKQSLD